MEFPMKQVIKELKFEIEHNLIIRLLVTLIQKI